MDLYAYSQIDKLDELVKANGIDIPRLRGYRLMSGMTPFTEEEIEAKARMSYRETKQLYTPKPHFRIIGYNNRRKIKGRSKAEQDTTPSRLANN